MDIENKLTLHFSKIKSVTERVAGGKPVPFSFVYGAQNGDIVVGLDAIVTSVDNDQHTRNVEFFDEKKKERVARTLCNCLFLEVEIEGKKVEIVAN